MVDPSKRLTTEGALEHPWLQVGIESELQHSKAGVPEITSKEVQEPRYNELLLLPFFPQDEDMKSTFQQLLAQACASMNPPQTWKMVCLAN